MISIQKTVGLVVIVILLVVGFIFTNSSKSRDITLASATPEFVHQENGETYYIVEGNFYQLEGETLKFIDTLYDVDFYRKNYVVENNSTFQIDPETGKKYAVVTRFEDGFENTNSFENLFAENKWHTNTINQGNQVSVSQNLVHQGKNSLRTEANPSSVASKASIGRNLMYFDKGDDVYISGWFYLEPTPDIYDGGGTTFFDVESSWMKSMGIRSIIKSGDAFAMELEFLGKNTFRQKSGKEIPFPTGRWVHIETHIYLSDENGLVEVWQDGVKIIDERGRTLPLANTVLDKVEVGMTAIAAGAQYKKVLYVDDFVISNEPIK